MSNEVWGGITSWGLEDYSDGSHTFSVCPVCRSRVDEAQASGKTNYAGVSYRFCSKHCQKNFEAAPGSYIGQPHAPSRVNATIDINTALPEDIRRIFHTDDETLH